MKNVLQEFLRLLEQSVIVQAGITLGFCGTACYMWIIGRSLPDVLIACLSIVLGFYFGSKGTMLYMKGVSK